MNRGKNEKSVSGKTQIEHAGCKEHNKNLVDILQDRASLSSRDLWIEYNSV